MPSHPLACFAAGAPAAAVAPIGFNEAAPLAVPLTIARLWLGGDGAAALELALPSLGAREPGHRR